MLERQCKALDNAIDAAVYPLYGLTDDEIKIVEGR
jgi:type II restriction/modification system DNA methylase subunit YeeA